MRIPQKTQEECSCARWPNAVVAATVVCLLALHCAPSHAETVTATVTADDGAPKPGAKEDYLNPWVLTNDEGDFFIYTEALWWKGNKTNCPKSSARWPASNKRAKNKLKTTAPKVTGSDDNPMTSSNADYAEAGIDHTVAKAYSYGTAHTDEDPWPDEYRMQVHAYAVRTVGCKCNAESSAKITDPMLVAWNDSGNHTLIFNWRMRSGTEIAVGPDPNASAGARSIRDSYLDVDNDGTLDQLFWSAQMGWVNGRSIVDVELGPGIFIYDGRSESSVEAELEALFSEAGQFELAREFSVPFAYTFSADGPGSLAYTYDLNGEAIVEEDAAYDIANIGGSMPAGRVDGYPADPGSKEPCFVTAGGADISGTADQFSYVYRADPDSAEPRYVSGDFTAMVAVDSLALGAEPHDWVKAGIMARESLDPGSAHTMVVRTPANSVAFQGREYTGHESWHANLGGRYLAHETVWLRLDRKGDTFTASYAIGGVTPPKRWAVSVSRDGALANDLYIGLATTSHEQWVPVTVEYRGLWTGPFIGSAKQPEFSLPPDSPTGSSSYIGVREVIDNGTIWNQTDCYRSLGSGFGTIVDYTASVLNIRDADESGHFANDDAFGVVTAGYRTRGSVDHLSLLARGIFHVPQGQGGVYTFCVNTDDGFTLHFPGRSFISVIGGSMATFDSGKALCFHRRRPLGDTLGAIDLPAGDHEFWLTFHETGGGAAVELSVARGRYEVFDSSAFRLVGQQGGGGAVQPPQQDWQEAASMDYTVDVPEDPSSPLISLSQWCQVSLELGFRAEVKIEIQAASAGGGTWSAVLSPELRIVGPGSVTVRFKVSGVDLYLSELPPGAEDVTVAWITILVRPVDGSPGPEPGGGLVAHWTFDEGSGRVAYDSSGHGLHGTLVGGVSRTWSAGQGSVLAFDGIHAYVDCGEDPLFDITGPITVAAWVNITSVPSDWRTIIAKGDSAWRLSAYQSERRFLFGAGGAPWLARVAGFVEVASAEWHHVCGTYDGQRLRLYVDGLLDVEKPWTDPIPTNDYPVYISENAEKPGRFWDGMIDDVRLYDRALNDGQIGSLLVPVPSTGASLKASAPNPPDGAESVDLDVRLTWTAGFGARLHYIVFGEDYHEVSNAPMGVPSSVASYTPGPLRSATTYYWRVDEFDDSEMYKGDVWSFTTGDFIVVDDFEDYNAGDNQIWFSWHDGLGYGVAGTREYYGGNGTGAAVGDETSPSYTEETIIHGGSQSLPVWFDNNKQGFAKYSQTERTLTAPRDWTKDDVADLSLWFRGHPASVGSFVEGPVGTYTMTGAGADIWDEGDEFHYVYKMLYRAGSIVARVDSLENTNSWAKAGVMIRETLDPNSVHAFACLTPGNGVAFQRRHTRGGSSFNTNETPIGVGPYFGAEPYRVPYWVKIERDLSGNFTASHSSNGTTWVQLGTPENIPMGANAYIGLALTSHDAALTCQAVFSNVALTGRVGSTWQNQDVGILSNDAEPLYIALSNPTGAPGVVVHPDPQAAQIDTWTQWLIPVRAFADRGIDLTDVDRIAIGLGTQGNMTVPGGSGKIFVDDIRLYRSRNAPDGSLVGQWTFEEGGGDVAYDSSGRGNHGWLTQFTSPDPSWIEVESIGPRSSSHALDFHGSGYVDLGNPNVLNFGTGDWSVSAWIRTTQWGTDDEDKGTLFANGGDWSGGMRYTLAVGETYDGAVTLTTDDDVTKVQVMGTAVVNDDQWHHVAGVRDGSLLRLYIDAEPDGTAGLPAGYDLSGTSQHHACIGAITDNRDGSRAKYFRGLIDEVQINNRALSHAEVRAQAQ